MDDKLQQIVHKLYAEGIEKAEIEAVEIVQKAQKQAADIIQQAEIEKQALLTLTQAEAEALRNRTHAELQLVITRALEKLKQDIAGLIKQKAVDLPVEQALNSNETIAALLPEVVKQLFGGGKGQITIRVAQDKAIYVSQILANQIANVLEQEPVVIPDKSIASGFKIGRTGENYVISFTNEDFKAYIGNFMHPEIAKIFKSNE